METIIGETINQLPFIEKWYLLESSLILNEFSISNHFSMTLYCSDCFLNLFICPSVVSVNFIIYLVLFHAIKPIFKSDCR